MKYYSSTDIAKMFGMTNQSVINWARKNNVMHLDADIRQSFLWTDDDIERFKVRRKCGRPKPNIQ